MRERVVGAVVAGLWLFGSNALHAQSAAPPAPRVSETVVVTATVAPVPADASGRAVSTITREDIRTLGLTSVIDALRLLSAVDLHARGPRDVQTDISIHGATFGQSLVLFDGFRLNDSQSGHHNGDIPIPIAAVDRIEVVTGPGSTAHGADALGGTINVLPRQDAHMAGELLAGQYGFASAQASIAGHGLPAQWTVTGWGSRSGGFTTDRDFAQGGAALRAPVSSALVLDLRGQRKAFGANGFYGASPSKEWTDQTLASAAWRRASGAWVWQVRGLYRNHGDHFRWDINRPGFAENRHRTDAVEGTLVAQREFSGGRRLSAGAGAAGDWIDSSNLGDHRYAHTYAFAEAQWPVAARAAFQGGVRLDHYSSFGHAVTPGLSLSVRANDRVRVRASAGRAFRIPTFTELYYRDPAHFARADLTPERGWSVDGGVDVVAHGWTAAVTPFARWDENVIDWVRAQPTDLWRTTNVRDVQTQGIDVSLLRRFRAGSVRVGYTGLMVDAPSLDLLSKYVLEYAKHTWSAAVAVPLPASLRLSVQADHRRRLNGQVYSLVAARVSRPIRALELFVDGTNLFNESYIEVPGVLMPGRWLTMGVTLR